MFATRRAALALSPLALFLAGNSAAAQDPARMDALVAASAAENAYMGAALVAVDGEVVFDKAYGSADLEWKIANTTDTKFRIGSVTKQFTAASILLLQQRGLLDIDQPVRTYLPESPASWDAITLRHLLQHTSGIPNLTDFDDFGTWKYLPTTLDALLARFSDKPLDFAPGEKWSYSNSGYMVLAAVAQQVSGQSLDAFMAENIFTPLGMDNTGIDRSEEILPHRAAGYSPSQQGIVNADHVDMSIPQGGGNIYSTTHDLLAWQRGLFGGHMLDARSLAEMTAPGVAAIPGSTYGLGVIRTEDDSGTLVWHGGGIEGFNAYLAHDPNRDITVVVLANLNGGAANTLGQSLLAMARGEVQ